MTIRDLIVEITKSVIALLIVVGGGYAILTNNSQMTAVVGLLGVVTGFYFNRVVTPTPPVKGE